MEMIKKLRIRFVIITMVIVTVMLVVIFGLLISLTHRRIYSDSVKMIIGVSGMPLGMNQNRRPERRGLNEPTDVQLPFFRVEVDTEGNIVATDGDFYDLTDEETINSLVSEVLSRKERLGDLSEYNLRYFRAVSSPQRNDSKAPGMDIPGKAPEKKPGMDPVAEPKPVVDTGEVKESSKETETTSVNTTDVISGGKEDFDPSDIKDENWDGKSNRIIVFADVSSEIATMKNLTRNCFFSGLLSFIVFLVIAMFFARWSVKPVEDAWIQQRQFVSDASHELKTPLSVILTDAEMLRSRDFDEEKKKQFADNILTMSHQMRGLVESLLQLARVDNGAIQKAPEQMIDLSQMVSNEVMTFEVMFFEKGLMLTEDVEKGISIKGAPQYIKQVIEILLDNAQKYSFPNGTVEVSLKKSGSHRCLLSVADPGEKISDEDLKNIFKRFYRIDEARAMNHSYGLGLSIAQNIVKDHKGRIWAESKNGINTFRVELPLA
ncbi:histidine kinase [Lachnospiraceae bacterium JC7]|nr:histidine kinase [Lachnospiraceae bacterium JC7]